VEIHDQKRQRDCFECNGRFKHFNSIIVEKERLEIRPNMSLNPFQFSSGNHTIPTFTTFCLDDAQISYTTVPSERLFSKADNIMTE
jgi:hypothetical protein